MGFSDIIHRAGRGVASVGRAVQQASQKLDQVVAGTPSHTQVPAPAVPGASGSTPLGGQPPVQSASPSEGTPPSPQSPSATMTGAPSGMDTPGGNVKPTAAPAQAAPRGLPLPELGPAPDQNATEFQGDGGKERYATAASEYQHKQDIHDAFQQLDKIYSDAHPGRDFQKEYEEQLATMKQGEKERPQGSGLARFALALGDNNPAVRQSGRSNLDTYNQNVDKAAGQSDESFSKRMALRRQMHEQKSAELEQQGKWKQALAEQEKLALLSADEQHVKHTQDMEKTAATQSGSTDRAQIRADAMQRSAQTRAQAIGSAHGLSGGFAVQFEKEAAKAIAKMLGPRDLTKEYTPGDLDAVSNTIEHLAEMFHDQQFGDGSSNTYLGTHPRKRPQPQAAGSTGAKPKF